MSKPEHRSIKRKWTYGGDALRKFIDMGTVAFFEINRSSDSSANVFHDVKSVCTITVNELVFGSYEELVAFIDIIDLWMHRKNTSKRDFLAQLSKDLAKLTIVNPCGMVGAILMIVGVAMNDDSRTGELLGKFGMACIVASHLLSSTVTYLPKDKRKPIKPNESRIDQDVDEEEKGTGILVFPEDQREGQGGPRPGGYGATIDL